MNTLANRVHIHKIIGNSYSSLFCAKTVTVRIGLVSARFLATIKIRHINHRAMLKTIVTLIALLFTSCKDSTNQHGNNTAPSSSENSGIKSPFTAKELEIDGKIKAMESPAEFKQAFADFHAAEGLWNNPKNKQFTVVTWFFRAWFNKDPMAALAAISTIPNSDGGFLRRCAIAEGIKYCADAPEAYIEAANTLFTEDQASLILYNVFNEMFKKSPNGWFEFVEKKLGQGRTKQIAISTLFGLQVDKNFRRAVEYAQKLAFEEDRRDAFVSIGSPAKLPTLEDLDWAESLKIPEGDFDRIRNRILNKN